MWMSASGTISGVLGVGGMYYPGLVLSSVDMVLTSLVPFQLVVEGPVQPPGHRGRKSRCSTK